MILSKEVKQLNRKKYKKQKVKIKRLRAKINSIEMLESKDLIYQEAKNKE